jgi:hypothetical protein
VYGVGMYFVLSECAISHFFKISSGMWVGTPWGGCIFHGSNISYL